MAESILESQDFGFQDQLVAGNHLAPELDAVHLAQDHELPLGIGNRMKEQDPSRLGDGFDDQHARHDHPLGKMPLEKRLVGAHVLHRHDGLPRMDLPHPVDEKEREPVREESLDFFDLNQRRPGYFAAALEAS